MNSSRKLGWFLVLALAPIFPSLALTLNDGGTTNNLTQIFNSSPDSQGAAVVELQVTNCSTNCALTAVQTGKSLFFALRSAWYANDVAPTSGVYTVSAAFEPANVANQNRGGVMGWLSLSASNGIILQVVPEESPSDPKSFRVALVDFSADNGNDNESLAHLFNTNGTSASGEDFTSAWSDLGTNYSATNFATFQLAFSAPTAADLAALSNATAHVTARVFQGETNDTLIQVSRTIELLTDLPLPPRGSHRIGYYAVWASFFEQGDAIGYLDNLTGEGGVGSTANGPPSVSISSPAGGETFTGPTNITIVANATDNDGTITQVDFFSGATLLGTATNNPFTFTWTNVVAGSYLLTARATDDGGGTSTSSPVNITVTTSTGAGPTLKIGLAANNTNTIEISWLREGYQLQMATNLSSPIWIDVPDTLLTNRVALSISGATVYFRLFQQSAPAGPRLTILLSDTSVVVSWPAEATSYRLQTKSDLNAAIWTEVATTTNQVREIITGQARFYRLSR